ncbi:MAG TPA: bifunctional demethylmenaquinone methyltransferase/2-methoxy-6-polyprenyl-1,4-benzoquinol methylase UbiE [Deltaproteobacteria bacterium]|nr:bifunctional demethylmenaquinone methyltransferase/2-methoxy-6-polyprenyl-1,4-benzoquinol methylase UbiE [Deltaproteobacteria bacterium]
MKEKKDKAPETGEKKTYFGNRVVAVEEKKGLVRQVFDSVADKYDLMNDLMSFGTHRLWKRFLVEKTGLRPGDRALDVAGGTADIALLMAERVGAGGRVVVYDINGEMLRVGRDKCIDRGRLDTLWFVQGDAERISFADNTFHCATVGFGIRNVTHIGDALEEMTRVVKPGGRVLCLEFSHPTSRLFSRLYDIYSFSIIPRIGERITGNREAYTYLPESIRKFPAQEEFKAMMERAGLYGVRYYNIFGGVAALHVGHKV